MYSISITEIEDVWFAVVLDGTSVVASSFSCMRRDDVVRRITRYLHQERFSIQDKPEGLALNVLRNMHDIYAGKPVEEMYDLQLNSLPVFTRKVLEVTRMIPHGYVASYGGIAKAVGKTGAARAVGNVQAHNPFAPIVPCHRVVASNLKLGGYGGGFPLKRAILMREGVTFNGNRVAIKHLWQPSIL